MLYTINLPKELKAKIDKFEMTLDDLPCVVIIHDLKDWSVIYMSKKGLTGINLTMEQVTALSADEYYRQYFNHEDAEDYVPKIIGLLERNNDDEMVSYFQQVRLAGSADWNWHMSSTKIFMRDESGKPNVSITISVPLEAMHHMTAKATRLLEENNFLRRNFKNYSKLTKREREILTQIALGKSAQEIAKELFISVTTAETHRKNIKQKLNANTYELMQYARAFDLV